jgi:hypothetical protein
MRLTGGGERTPDVTAKPRPPRLPLRAAAIAAVLALAPVALATAPASAAPGMCVGPGHGCFSSVQGAVDAAASGATIRIAAGTFRGGVRTSRSVTLSGAGIGRTRIAGGGPVIRISTPGAVRPRVTLADLTVAGGVEHGDDGVEATGGGVLIDPGPGGSLGAVVTIRRVEVSGNRTAPTRTSDSPSGVLCPDGDCPYAATRGGGIGSFGDLTLDHAIVRHNRAAGTASDAAGGGVFSHGGSLTLLHSAVSGNTAAPQRIGRYSEGGGVFADAGVVVVRDSSVDGNRADLNTRWPSFGQGELIGMNANSGGIHVGDGGSVLVERSSISHNVASAIDPLGEPVGFDSAMFVGDSALTMRHAVLRGNSAITRAATAEDSGPGGTVLEVDAAASITDTVISRNSARATATTGLADVTNGLGVFDFVGNPRQVEVLRTVISGNTAEAVSPNGSARAAGGGVLNNSRLTMRDSTVAGNRVNASAPSSTAQGGGIWNGVLLSGPPIELTLHGVHVTGNSATARTAEGGGLYTTVPVVLDRSRISGNHPDQCAGCSGTTTAAPQATTAAQQAAAPGPTASAGSRFALRRARGGH